MGLHHDESGVHRSRTNGLDGRESAMGGRDLRKASKDLMPSERPFFSLKALSSSPWSANPFMRTSAAHRAIETSCNA